MRGLGRGLPVRSVVLNLLSVLFVTVVASAQGHDTLGVASKVATITCPGTLGGTCITLSIKQCPEAPDTTATVKITYPAGGISASIGTVLFMAGEGGTELYEAFTHGRDVISNGSAGVVPAGYTAVQFLWNASGETNGWLTGPSLDGPRGLACRFATAALWAYNNGSARKAGTAFCGTGNSGGSSAYAYALSEFGLYQNFDMVEVTSGPPMGRVDLGCTATGTITEPPCNTATKQGYANSPTETGLIDGSYSSTTNSCANHVKTQSQLNLWRHDSVYSENTDTHRTLTFPSTDVRALYGGLDTSAAVPLGLDWVNVIKVWPSQSTVQQTCEFNDGHGLPDYLDAAQKIASDLIAHCTLHH